MDAKTIFGNLKRLPVWAWELILCVSLFLRDLAANLTVKHVYFQGVMGEVGTALPRMSGVIDQMLSMEWVMWIIEPAILLLLFEVVASILISIAMGRRALLIPKSYIVYELRIFYVGATLASAVLSPILLALPMDYGVYFMDLLKIPFYCGTYILYYYFSGRNAVVWGQKTSIWLVAATVVGVYYAGGGLISLATTLSAVERTTADVVMVSVIFAVSVFATAAMFLFAKYLKADEKRNPPPPPPTEQEEEPREIFKGFGF